MANMNLDALPRPAAEQSAHTNWSSWPASQDEDPSQHGGGGSSSNDNIHSSSPSLGFGNSRSYRNSAIWTSTDGCTAEDQLSESQNQDERQKQSLFMQEYNKLAEKYGLSILFFDDDDGGRDCLTANSCDTQLGDRRGWFARTFGKPPMSAAPRRSSRHSIGSRSDKSLRHKRDGSDPAAQSHSSKKDTADKLKNEPLQTLVRICGKSFLYLPSEYATRSLMLPTCLRAAAQYLVQNGPEARGVFRISGSMRVVNELYDYYCADLEYGKDIAATVRSPNLPFHIKVGVHDVACLFKRLLAGLPGGILGQVSLFNALADIHKTFGNRHDSNLEHTHILARLLALAIGSVPSIYQRELICAVFGLLSLIGHASELSSSLDGQETSLSNSERMGYGALGIIFGPLLLGDLLETSGTEKCDRSRGRSCTSSATTPSSPTNTSPRYKTDRRPKSMVSDRLPALPVTLGKILLANDITETVISHWRDVVSQMRAMGVMRKESLLQNQQQETQMRQMPTRNLRSCRSDTFTDNDERALPPQTPVFYGTRLRKARSASIEHNSNAIVSTKRSSLGQGLQRPTDMTFEEFAARKRLKSHASSMSMASETTMSMTLNVQESAALPRSTVPSAITSNNAAVNIPLPPPGKDIKSNRMSGEQSSPFCDRPMLPRTENQSVGRSDFPQRGETSVAPSPWKINLRPARPVPAGPQANGNLTAPTSSVKGHSQFSDETIACRAPLSKTAALVSRFTNPRHQPVNSEKIADTGTNAASFSQMSPYQHGTTDNSPFGRHRVEEQGLENRSDKFRCMLGSATTSGTTLQEEPTPTPKRHWRSRNNKPPSVADDNSVNATPVTPLGKVTMPVTRASDENIQTPLSEIKNDARGLGRTRARTVTTRTAPLSPGILEKKMRDCRADTMSTAERENSKPAAVGSAVKAMAALFDNASRKEVLITPPAKQTQKAVWSQENRAKMAPHTPRRHGRTTDADEELWGNSATKKQNQHRLSKSEDRNGRLSRVGRLAAIDQNNLTGSADRGAAAEVTAETRLNWRRSTGLLRADSKRGLVSERRAEDSKVALIAEHYTQRIKVQELQQSLEAKIAECQTWKDRAEVAERRVAELENLLTGISKGQSFF